MEFSVTRIYNLPREASNMLSALSNEGYFEKVESEIKALTNFTDISTTELKTDVWVMSDDYREDCKLAVKIIKEYYKELFKR